MKGKKSSAAASAAASAAGSSNGAPCNGGDGDGPQVEEDEEDKPGAGFPTQDPAERRVIRHEYRALMHDMQENAHDLINPESNELSHKLLRTNEIFAKVKMAREAALDSSTVAMISQLGRRKAQQINTDFVVFHPGEYADKLVHFLTGQRAEDTCNSRISKIGWENLGKAVQPFLRRSPALHFMHGAFESAEPKQKVRQKKQANKDKDKNVAETHPKMITSAGASREVTTEEVERVLGKLWELYKNYSNSPICLIEFVTNPYSFGHTVENIFHVSFLVRDGHARIFLDEDRLPVIEPVQTSGAPPVRDLSNMDHVQVVLNITMADWRTMIDTFQIEDAAIPSRASPPS